MDHFFKGFLSGMTGGLIMDLWGFLVKDLLRIATRNYIDWAAVTIYGFLPTNFSESLFAFGTHLLWTGFLGIVLAYLLPRLSSQGYRIKGAFLGFIIGFFIYGIAILFRMPFFTKIPFPTSVTNAIGGLLWGIITAHMLGWLDQKTK